jgi:hypothetical protein
MKDKSINSFSNNLFKKFSVPIVFIIALVIIITGVIGIVLYSQRSKSGNSTDDSNIEEYKPVINPDNFTTNITNPYLKLPVGRELTYESKTDGEVERTTIVITSDTKVVMGVTTRIYWDRVWLNDILIEDTRDYLAQDNNGDVWYFGEDVDNYNNGKVINHNGSWLAGVDGAQPGIWIKAEQIVGDSYRQEYYKEIAEDMRDVVSINETVKIDVGTYHNCVKMYDWTPLEPEVKEYKYYCTEVGALVLEKDVESGEYLELKVDTHSDPVLEDK